MESFLFGRGISAKKDESDSSSSSSEDEEEEEEKEQKDEADSSSSSEDEAPAAQTGRKRKAAWEDEDDAETLVRDVAASYNKAKGKHGQKEFSKENYAETLRKKFKTLVDTPKWADLSRRHDDEDSDEEFFRVS